MGINISGAYRIQEIYMAEKAAYITAKDKASGDIVKFSHALPLPKTIVDDGLVKLEGAIKTRIYQGKVSLEFDGIASAVSEK